MAVSPRLSQKSEIMSNSTGGPAPVKPRQMRVGFRTSIITLFIAIVLLVGLTLVYLSFARISAMTQTAATTFIAKVAQLGADRIDARFKTVRDSLEVLAGLPAVQSAELRDNTVLYSLMASMLRNNPQLFNLYVGYEDGSFLEMDVIERAGATFRTSLDAPEDTAYRLFMISRTDSSQPPLVTFLSENLIPLAEVPGPTDYDPRRRPWYGDAFKGDGNVLTGPYVFFATGQPGYTLRLPLQEGRRGVAAADILLNEAEAMLIRQRLGKSGIAFLFNDDDRIIAHPQMADLMSARPAGDGELPQIETVSLPGLSQAIHTWRGGGAAQQFFDDREGRTYLAAFEKIQTAGDANIRLAVVAPLDEFYSEIIAERRRLFIVAMLFVAAMLPIVLWIGAILARSLRNLARQTDSIQRFELADHPRFIRRSARSTTSATRSPPCARWCGPSPVSSRSGWCSSWSHPARRCSSAARGARSRCCSPTSPTSPPRPRRPTRPTSWSTRRAISRPCPRRSWPTRARWTNSSATR